MKQIDSVYAKEAHIVSYGESTVVQMILLAEDDVVAKSLSYPLNIFWYGQTVNVT